ncbi:hypothetical protein KIN20_002164, partial [Parelaphostrongylus tenuis]
DNVQCNNCTRAKVRKNLRFREKQSKRLDCALGAHLNVECSCGSIPLHLYHAACFAHISAIIILIVQYHLQKEHMAEAEIMSTENTQAILSLVKRLLIDLHMNKHGCGNLRYSTILET